MQEVPLHAPETEEKGAQGKEGGLSAVRSNNKDYLVFLLYIERKGLNPFFLWNLSDFLLTVNTSSIISSILFLLQIFIMSS